MKSKKVKGFTLIELIICVAIIALILAVAIPKYNKARLSAVVAAHNSNVNNLKSAAILADIENKEVNNVSALIDYLEGEKLPEIPKELGVKEWIISKDSKNNIVVEPGLVKLVDGEIQFIEGK